MNVDLHTHTNISDGSLSPDELIKAASESGVDILSITDHDSISAYSKLSHELKSDIKLISGIEFSSEWNKTGIHIVGLNIQLDSDAIQTGVTFQAEARIQRAKRIAEKLEKLGFDNIWEDVLAVANESVIGRPHFARILVERGIVKDVQQAFSKYLGAGKTGDVKQYWSSMAQVIEWIRDAGGIAVLAHPKKYKLTRTKLLLLTDAFKEAGGEALEVISGQQKAEVTRLMTQLCEKKNLLASVGSDFHQPGQPWSILGRVPLLPAACRPIWNNWI